MSSTSAPKGRGRGRSRPSQSNSSNSAGPVGSSQSTSSNSAGPVGSSQSNSSNSAGPVGSSSNTRPRDSPDSSPKGRGRGRGLANVSRGSTSPPPAKIIKYDSDGRMINPHTAHRNKKHVNQLEPIHRKDYGREGKPIKLYTNFYELDYKADLKIHQYEISIDVSEKALKANKSLAMEIFNQMVEDYKDEYFHGIRPVFDGTRIMYTNKSLELDKMTKVPINFKSNVLRDQCINIEIKPTRGLVEFSDIEDLYNKATQDMPLNVFSCADIILGFMPKMSYISFGRNYFPRGQRVHDLENGIQLWSGSVMAVKPGQWKLLVNIDEKHTAFYKAQSLKDFMLSMFRMDALKRLEYRDLKRINEHIRGLRVQVTHNGYPRKHRVVCITEKSATRHKITDHNTQQEVTVDHYFRTVKNMTLEHPDLPCVQVEPRNKNIFFPVELCSIVEGQRCIRSLTDRQVASIIKTAAKKPDVKKRTIDSAAKSLIDTSSEVIDRYGIRINDQPLRIRGRILQPPALKYYRGSVNPRLGVWDNRNQQFIKTHSLRDWALMILAPKTKFTLDNFRQQMQKECSNTGISMSDPLDVQYVTERDFPRAADHLGVRFHDLKYIFVVLPERSTNKTYSMVKEAEVRLGVATQCIKLETILRKFKSQTVGNILMKTNTKLGGVNWELSYDMSPLSRELGNYVFAEPVMIIGADVTHWSRDEGGKPSIAAVVCTLDNRCSKYGSRIRLQSQQGRQSDEIIHDFKNIMKELLIEFKNSSKTKPGKILYYRDGVSQGQFVQTLTEELAGIQAACKELEEGFEPKITYINAQKRHHTRLFCAESRDADRSGNVPAGTVVDTDITHPVFHDFYLNSHCGIQGTNRACHYTVLWDDSDMSPDMIQLLTYYLCHTYARCTRSVSYPAPTYYAHLVCTRARTMLGAMDINWRNPTQKPDIQAIQDKLSQHKSLSQISYFV